MSTVPRVGTLFDPLCDAASRIKSRAHASVQVVWVPDQGNVLSAEFGAASQIAFDLMIAEHIGTYTMLAEAVDVEDGLRVGLLARAGTRLVDMEPVS